MGKTDKKSEEGLPLLLDTGVTFRMTGVANRLNRSASAFYRSKFGVGVQDWRLLLVLGRSEGLTVGDAATAADIDTAAASRALKILKDRKLVTLEMTSSRGRATIARLTPAGREMCDKLGAAGADRAAQIISGISPDDVAKLHEILGKILANVEQMTADLEEDDSSS